MPYIAKDLYPNFLSRQTALGLRFFILKKLSTSQNYFVVILLGKCVCSLTLQTVAVRAAVFLRKTKAVSGNTDRQGGNKHEPD